MPTDANRCGQQRSAVSQWLQQEAEGRRVAGTFDGREIVFPDFAGCRVATQIVGFEANVSDHLSPNRRTDRAVRVCVARARNCDGKKQDSTYQLVVLRVASGLVDHEFVIFEHVQESGFAGIVQA